jgi:hypothetical protein
VEEENMTASHPVFKPVTLPDFQNGNDKPLRKSIFNSLICRYGLALS